MQSAINSLCVRVPGKRERGTIFALESEDEQRRLVCALKGRKPSVCVMTDWSSFCPAEKLLACVRSCRIQISWGVVLAFVEEEPGGILDRGYTEFHFFLSCKQE